MVNFELNVSDVHLFVLNFNVSQISVLSSFFLKGYHNPKLYKHFNFKRNL